MKNYSPKRKKRIRRKRITLVIEVIVLLAMAAFALGSGWVKGKLNMINFQETDDSRLVTAAEANADYNVDEAELEGKDMFALVGIDTREDAGGNNSDTMIIASVDHDKKTIKLVSLYRDTYLNIGEDEYYKCNAAYAKGGAIQMLNMINLNLDLNMREYISVNFNAVVDTIDLLGGLDIEVCRQELDLINGLNAETSRVTGHEFVEIFVPSEEDMPDGVYWTAHLDGAQALSYARIRYTAGNDFRRAARQRLVLSLMMQKAKDADLATQNAILNKVLPQVETNAESSKLLSLAKPLLSYTIEDSVGFPFDHYEDRGELTGLDCVLPATLESNVRKLHAFLFGTENYQPSQTMLSYSDYIKELTGITEEDAPEESEDGSLPWMQEGVKRTEFGNLDTRDMENNTGGSSGSSAEDESVSEAVTYDEEDDYDPGHEEDYEEETSYEDDESYESEDDSYDEEEQKAQDEDE